MTSAPDDTAAHDRAPDGPPEPPPATTGPGGDGSAGGDAPSGDGAAPGDGARAGRPSPRPRVVLTRPAVRIDPTAPPLRVRSPAAATPRAAPPAGGPVGDEAAEPVPEGPLRREEVYRHDVVGGRERPETALTRLIDRLRALLRTPAADEEAELDARLAVPRALGRSHVVAFASSKGGVGKTSCTMLVGSLLADATRRPVLAIDTNPDFGSLGRLAPDDRRSDRTMEDLLDAIETDVGSIVGAAELSPFVSRTPSGLDLLASPRDPAVMARMNPQRYGLLLDVLSRFYAIVLLDLGTGVADELPQFALSRADQAVVVTASAMVTNATVLDALSYVRTGDGHATVAATTVVRNMTTRRDPGDQDAIERRFRAAGADEIVSIPRDDRLATMLDSGTYVLADLPRDTRVAVKRLGLSVLDRLG